MNEIDKTVLVGLQKVLDDKTRAYYEVQNRMGKRESELRREMNEKLRAEFGVEAEATNRAKIEAESAVRAEAARIREIESAARIPYLEGTKLVEWAYPRWSSGNPMGKTGETAVLEIFKEGDDLPFKSRFNRPSVGGIVLRAIKKDGTPGSRVKCWNDIFKKYWFPEGVDPNVSKA